MSLVRAPVKELWTCARGSARRQSLPDAAEQPRHELPFPLRYLWRRQRAHLIKSTQPVNKCAHCGSYYRFTHTCAARRRDFYFHHVRAQSADWWEKISFFPIGAPPGVRRLFITYDVETYTWHGRFGKQLVPFLLVFTLSGDDDMVRAADAEARARGWTRWEPHPHTYYHLNPQRRAVGGMFRELRDALQRLFASRLWGAFLEANPHLHAFALKQGLADPEELSPEALAAAAPFAGEPRFLEVYVVGHNISGFDEIVLAAQVVNCKHDLPAPFTVRRNFMPRNGRILFNDITLALPNPAFKARSADFDAWRRGRCDASDFAAQSLRFLVRDTFALTHTSLRNAARAYDLPDAKGHCPYAAVNDFYMKGAYRVDAEGFPAADYWSDEAEYADAKAAWLRKKQARYNIVEETLAYCVTDVLVTAQLVHKLLQSYADFVVRAGLPDANFNVFQRPTISSNSHAIFKQLAYRAHSVDAPNLGDALLAPSNEMYEHVRASIRGGRCYPTYLGVLEEPVYVYDICGMYASALTHPLPSGRPLNPFDRAVAAAAWERRLQDARPISYFDDALLPAIFVLDADPPDETQLDSLPPFCSRKGGRLCWTNEPLRGEVATSIDAVTLHNRGWRVRLLPHELTVVFPRWHCLAREYVQLNISAKEEAERLKNPTMRSVAKLLSNALYGSFATRLDNKITVFSDQMEREHAADVASGTYALTASTFVETDDFAAEVIPRFSVQYLPRERAFANTHAPDARAPLYTTEAPPTYSYKPITLLDADETGLCLHTLQRNCELVHNARYPSHVASFVLAWTRAFISEWAQFLFEPDRGLPENARTLKAVYGDTDSLFLTRAGRDLMERQGRHRIKRNGGPLVFNPDDPQLTWLAECETVCARCGSDAYSSQSIFLAPKLYALRDITCPECGHVGSGKLRAKGHAVADLSYQTLLSCYLTHRQAGTQRYATTRTTLQKTLTTAPHSRMPFTVTQETLTRTLRPWQDPTLHRLDEHRLIPYSRKNPNPRNTDVCLMQLPSTP